MGNGRDFSAAESRAESRAIAHNELPRRTVIHSRADAAHRVSPDVAHAGAEHVVGVAAGEIAVIAQVDAGVLGDAGVGAQPQHYTVARRRRTEGGEADR